MKHALNGTLLALALLLAACGDDDPVSPAQDGAIAELDAGISPDAASPDPDSDAGEPDATTEPTDAGEASDGGADGGAADAGSSQPAGALSNYLPCDEDHDCPVGYGDCITSIQLNRRDSLGVASVSVKSLDPSLPKNGICSLVCTNATAACDGLSLRDLQGAPVAYQCQVVVAGAPVYPSPRPDFPFANQLVASELTAGVAFGSLCRPPFGLSSRVLDSFCADCANSSQCGSGLCWDFAASDEAQGGAGSCLMACAESAECPFGFSCQLLTSNRDGTPYEHGRFCVPWQNTCASCRDLDGDGRGLGRCGPNDQTTSADCDDRNPEAYHDALNSAHAFPLRCGTHDLNCNGLSDDVEQIGPDGFPAEHCTGCGQPCTGTDFTHGVRECQLVGGLPACVSTCSEGFSDCDHDLGNGCETPETDQSRFYYLDADQDGFGAGTGEFVCPSSAPPADRVNNHGDCDDGNAATKPGVTETCDGKDNNCNGATDEAPVSTVGDRCNTQLLGICAEGAYRCTGGRLECAQTVFAASEESCNGLDDDCDGAIDENVPGTGLGCTLNSVLGTCSVGEMRCNSASKRVECTQTVFPAADLPDEESIDSNCDGVDGEEGAAIYVDVTGLDSYPGTRAQPVKTLATALSKAQACGKTHVYLATGDYTAPTTLKLVNGISIFGGFDAGTWRHASSGRTVVIRAADATAADLSGIDGLGISAATYLQDLDVNVPDATASGGNVYGMRCKSCSGLKVIRTSLNVGSGAPGRLGGQPGEKAADGKPGTLGAMVQAVAAAPGLGGASACGANGGDAGGISSTGDHLGGQAGLPSGVGGIGGTVSPWNLPGGNGQNGANCTAAAAPGLGGGPASFMAGSASELPYFRVESGSDGATGGSGGGGGGGGGGHPEGFADWHFGGCGGSSGGCGGAAGQSGGGGGSSVGLLLWNSNGITLTSVAARAGGGGAGGSGGAGGVGGAGVAGVTANGTAPGGAGGGSGNGCGGAGGGGGAGGNSYGLLRDSGTALPPGNGNAFTGSMGGSGGTGGTGGMGGLGQFVTTPGTTGSKGGQGAVGEAESIKTL